MAQFNIDSHISDGKTLEWLALPDDGETAEKVRSQVCSAARQKFGEFVLLKRWTHVVDSNGYITVRMHA